MLPKHKKTGGYRIRPYGIEKEYEQIVRTPFVFLGIYYLLRVILEQEQSALCKAPLASAFYLLYLS